MGAADAQSAYNALAHYFGLRSRDAFLNSVQGGDASKTNPSSTESPVSGFLSEIFGDRTKFLSASDIFKNKLQDKVSDDTVKNTVCITAKNVEEAKNVSDVGLTNAYNNSSDYQGWGKKGDGTYTIGDITTVDNVAGNVTAYQVFPADTGLDIVDTDIISLFMNSLTTFEMSRAVPYLDVKVVGLANFVEKGTNFSSAPDFSLGRFLGAGENDPLMAKFSGDLSSARAKAEKLAVVAGMEVFTSPQTLVNAQKVSYDKNVGGRIDAFRPFMSIMGLKISDTGVNAATMSYKSADMTLKLFDKGRLSEVAPFVTPRRDGNVRFEITYGWSHPDGNLLGRASDAQADQRLGRLIDAMRVTESYVLVNSSFSFTDDGGVDITLKLAMDATSDIFNTDVASVSLMPNASGSFGSISLVELANRLESISSAFRNASDSAGGSVKLPQFLGSPSLDGLLTLNKDTLKALREFASKHTNSKKGSLASAASDLLDIIGKKSEKNSSFGDGKVSAIIKTRKQQAVDFIKDLQSTPDPFLLPTPMSVPATDLSKAGLNGEGDPSKSNQTYVSYGKLVLKLLVDAIKPDANTELQVVFSAFNQNAAAMFDHNIAQFPISLSLLQEDLKEEFEKRHVFTIDAMLRFIAEKHIQFPGSKAYGLSKIFQPNARDEKDPQGKFTEELKKKYGKDGDAIGIGEAQRENLDAIYGVGTRAAPAFTVPRVSMRVVTRKLEGSAGESKKVVRIFFSDAAAGRVMSTAEMVSSMMQKGFFTKDSISTAAFRGAQHSRAYDKIFEELVKKNVIAKLSDKIAAVKPTVRDNKAVNSVSELVDASVSPDTNDVVKSQIKERLNKSYVVLTADQQNGKTIKSILLDGSPYFFHGTMGSGIIDANLSSEQNDNLTSMYLAQRFSGQGSQPTAPRSLTMPFETHPARLGLTLWGCPLVKLAQKYFVDMGTNSTLDNFYVITKVDHEIDAGTFKTTVDMVPYDIYGKFLLAFDKVVDAFTQAVVLDIAGPLKEKAKTRK